MNNRKFWGTRIAILAFATSLAGACSSDQVTGPKSLIPADADRGFITGPITWSTQFRTAEGEMLEVCKEFVGEPPGGATAQSAAFTVTGTSTSGAGATSAEGPFAFSLADGECREIFASEIGTVSNLIVGEDGPSTLGQDVTVQIITYNNGVTATGSDVSATSANVTIGPAQGALVIFTNTASPLVTGCTLTLGYWKTHPEDWNQVGDPNTATFVTGDAFYSSGKTYLEVLNTAPKGDAYYILAHQYIAALLNVGAGASTTGAVSTALSSAGAYFAGGSATRAQLISWADQLAAFNEGNAGPEHCGS